MKFKKTFSLLFGIGVAWAVPMVYPIGNVIEPNPPIQPNIPIKPMGNIVMPKCVVHPMGEEYDLNLDGSVTVDDIVKVVNTWNSILDDEKYSLAYDFNKDNRVDIEDIMLIISKLGKDCHELYPKKENK